MSIPIPIQGIAGSIVYKLHQIPPYEELLVFINTPQFLVELRPFLEKHFSITGEGTDLELIDSCYNQAVTTLLSRLPQNTPSYQYLALTQDIKEISSLVLQYKQYNQELGSDKLKEIIDSCKHLNFGADWRFMIYQKFELIARSKESFGLISYFEEIYLQLLYQKLFQVNDFFRKFIEAKINTYSLMNAIKRLEKGQSKEHIMRHTLPLSGIQAITAMKTFAFGDLVGEIGNYLEIPSDQISVTTIESFLLSSEIRAANRAMLYGVSDERIIQYLEQLHHSLTNLKLAVIYTKTQASLAHTDIRMINYNQL